MTEHREIQVIYPFTLSSTTPVLYTHLYKHYFIAKPEWLRHINKYKYITVLSKDIAMSAEDEDYYMEVAVIPERLLGDETAGKFISRVREIDGVVNVTVQGPNYFARDLEIGDIKLKTTVKVGKLFVGISKAPAEDAIRVICDDLFAFPYHLHVGMFSKDRPTIVDVLGKSSYRRMGILERNQTEVP